MSEKEYQVVTSKQIRQQFNKLGFTFLFMLLMVFTIKLAYPFIQLYLEPLYQWIDQPSIELLIKNLVLILLVFVPFLVCAKSLKLKTEELFSSCKGNWKEIVQINFAVIGLNLLLTFLIGVFSLMLNYQNNQMIQTGILLDGNWIHFGLLFINYVFIIPFCEEFIFRGVSLRCFSKMGNYFAIVASSLLYALFQPNLPAAITCFFLGLILAIFALRYNSIYPTLFMHCAINLFFVVMELIPDHFAWVTGLLCIVVYGVAILAIYKFKDHKIIIPKEKNTMILWKEFFSCWTMISAMVIFVVLQIINLKG